MALQLEEIKQAIKSPRKQSQISQAVKHQQRLRFHSESYLETREISQPVTIFLDWVNTLIPKDKFAIFTNLFRFPSQTVEFVNRIYGELERIFEGRNAAINYQFTDPTLRDDWEWYRQEKLKEPVIWKDTGWPMMKTSINSVLIVDLPSVQSTDRPEPYFYWLGIENVIEYGLDGKTIKWIIFKQPGNKIAAFDDTFYRVFEVDKNNELGKMVSEKKHGLGFCPANFFWTSPLFQSSPDLKKAPISDQLANLDWLLFFSISKKHLDLYAPYPIYSAYEADCAFQNNSNGDYCDGGFLRDKESHFKMLRDGTVEKCPVCSDKRIAGVGSFIEVPVPTGDNPDLGRNPVQITTVDKDSLDYNVKEQERLKTEIYNSVIGVGGEVQQKTSINEIQVKANYEDKTSVLQTLKGNFEAAQKFVDDTICSLRYGDRFLGSSINWGTEFYIFTVDDLLQQYKIAKANGASEAQLDALSDQIIATENKNNPVQMQRMIILKHLEPYRHYTREELLNLYGEGLVDPQLMLIKINFSTFVDRFERENTNIIEFASNLDLNQKIKIITDEFKKYGTEQKTKKASETAQTSKAGNSRGEGDPSGQSGNSGGNSGIEGE